MRRPTWPVVSLALAAAGAAQEVKQEAKQEAPELWQLQPVIQRAVERVRPSVVTIETFGGTRKSVVPQQPGQKPPVPKRPEPEPEPEPKPEGDPEGDQPGEKPSDEKDDKDKKKPPLGPIVMPGFLQAQGPSSGLVIGKDGWILTSRFTLNYDPSTILVTFEDGRKFPARVMGSDKSRGLAVLKVEANDLPVPELAPADKIEVGQWAFAVARSFASGGQPTVHAGMVSAVRRIGGRAVQTDASTSPANYGGPLVDLEGRVMGLVTPLSPQGDMAGADWYDSGIGFAVTLSDIGDKIEAMKTGAVFARGMLGVRMDTAFLGPGGKVMSTSKRSAASHADLRKGDVVLALDDVEVRHSMHLQDLVGARVAGDWVRVRVRKVAGHDVEVLVQLDAQ